MSEPSRRLVHVTTTDMSLALLMGYQLRAFADAGYEVIGVSAPGPYVERLEGWGIRHVPLRHVTRSISPFRDLRALRELQRVFVGLRADIVHTHNPKTGVYGRIAAHRVRTPVILNTVHGLYAQPGDPWIRRTVIYRLERFAAARSDAEIFQNAEDAATLERIGVPKSKIHVLGGGVNLARFDPDRSDAARVQAIRESIDATSETIVVGVVGRLVAEKGLRDVFEAAAMLQSRCPEVRFMVVGPSEPEKSDALSATELEHAANAGVRFLGSRNDMEDLYAAMDLFVLASYREGLPGSAMEAAAMGVPAIATDIRGCRDVVDDGATGRLVPPRDPEALADAIESLARDRAQRNAMSVAARAKARRDFDEREVVQQTLALYERLMNEATG